MNRDAVQLLAQLAHKEEIKLRLRVLVATQAEADQALEAVLYAGQGGFLSLSQIVQDYQTHLAFGRRQYTKEELLAASLAASRSRLPFYTVLEMDIKPDA